MSNLDRRQFAAFAAAALTAPTGLNVHAQARPELAKILVPFPAGGTTDAVARQLAEHLRGDLADAVIVDNRTGASGRLAIQGLKQAPADGLTLMVHAGGIQSLYPHVFKQLGYEPWSDVAPVSTLCKVEVCLAVGPGVPASVKTLQDYVAWIKSDTRHASFASGGSGTPGHVLISALGRQVGVDLVAVQYRSGSAAFPEVMGGQLPAISATLNDAIAQLPSGKVRILASSGDRRSPLAPDVPTFAESGYGSLTSFDFFQAFVHGSTPTAVQDRVSAAVRKALSSPALIANFKRLAVEPVGSTPQEALRMAQAASETNARLIKAIGFQPE